MLALSDLIFTSLILLHCLRNGHLEWRGWADLAMQCVRSPEGECVQGSCDNLEHGVTVRELASFTQNVGFELFTVI